MDQVDLGFGRLDACPGFLLKRVDYPKIHVNLQGIDHPISLTTVGEGDLEDARAEAPQRLGGVGLASLGGERESVRNPVPDSLRKCVNAFRTALIHEIRLVSLLTGEMVTNSSPLVKPPLVGCYTEFGGPSPVAGL